jgi:hypothetical protein
VHAHTGLWPDQPDRSNLACWNLLRKAVMTLIAYNTVIGFPIMAYLSAGKDFNLAIESVLSTFFAAVMLSVFFSIVYRRHHLEGTFEAMEAMRASGSKLPLQPESILREKREQSTKIARLMLVVLSSVPLMFVTLPTMMKNRGLLYL